MSLKLFEKIFSVEKNYANIIIYFLGIKITLKRRYVDYGFINCHVSNEIFVSNCIKAMHSKTFPKYKNCHKGQDIVLVATGPTLNYYSPIHNGVHIGVNRAYKNSNIKLDYLFVVDFHGTNKENIEEIVNYPANIFLGTYYSLNTSAREHSIPLIYKELPHVNCYAIDYPRNLRYPDLEFCGLMDYGSTIFNAAHFATYTHPKRIFLVGCDCSNTGHYDNSPPYNDLRVDSILNGWIMFKEYCSWYYPDVEIISINPIGLKGLFKDVYTQSYVNDHPELMKEDIEILDDEIINNIKNNKEGEKEICLNQ